MEIMATDEHALQRKRDIERAFRDLMALKGRPPSLQAFRYYASAYVRYIEEGLYDPDIRDYYAFRGRMGFPYSREEMALSQLGENLAAAAEKGREKNK